MKTEGGVRTAEWLKEMLKICLNGRRGVMNRCIAFL